MPVRQNNYNTDQDSSSSADLRSILSWALSILPESDQDKVGKSLRKLFAKSFGTLEGMSFKGAWWKNPNNLDALIRYWEEAEHGNSLHRNAPIPGLALVFAPCEKRFSQQSFRPQLEEDFAGKTKAEKLDRFENWMAGFPSQPSYYPCDEALADNILVSLTRSGWMDSLFEVFCELVMGKSESEESDSKKGEGCSEGETDKAAGRDAGRDSDGDHDHRGAPSPVMGLKDPEDQEDHEDREDPLAPLAPLAPAVPMTSKETQETAVNKDGKNASPTTRILPSASSEEKEALRKLPGK